MEIVVGSVVYSKAGRDKGRYYMVVRPGSQPEHFLIVDGETRRLERPKLKKAKHLKNTGAVVEKIADKLKEDKLVHNSEIRSALKTYNGTKSQGAENGEAGV